MSKDYSKYMEPSVLVEHLFNIQRILTKQLDGEHIKSILSAENLEEMVDNAGTPPEHKQYHMEVIVEMLEQGWYKL